MKPRLVLRAFPLSSILAATRSGDWLTPERVRLYPALLGSALCLALVGLIATSHGAIDHWGRPLGTDFSGFWVAGKAVLAGHPAQPYDNTLNAAAQAAAFGHTDAFLPWPYPPYFLALAALLATMPYLPALVAWQGVTLWLYMRATLCVAAGLPRGATIIAALAFPAVAINVLHGHNGLLSAALLAGGGLLLPRRPVVAGVLLGLLAYKPQFALAIPVAMLAGRHWQAVAAASVTVLLTTVTTYAAFGPAPWLAFVANLSFTRHVVLELGGLESYKLQSAFSAVRLVGGSVPLAYGAQIAVSFVVLAGLAIVWRGHTDHRLKLAGLIVASLLATPYAVDYDMTMLGPALAALASLGVERGFPPYGKSLLGLVWIMPLGARSLALATSVPFGLLTMAVLFGHILARADRRILVFATSMAQEVKPRRHLF